MRFRAHRRVWLLQKFLRKRSIDFPGCSRMYKDLFCALLHGLFLFMAKGQRKEMLSWCSAVGHIQRIFTSTLLQYNFSCSSVFASSARKGSESPFQTGLTHYVPGKHFCLLFPVCSKKSHMVPNLFSVEGFHSHTVTHWYESTGSFFFVSFSHVVFSLGILDLFFFF